jgi:hypothetical protein
MFTSHVQSGAYWRAMLEECMRTSKRAVAAVFAVVCSTALAASPRAAQGQTSNGYREERTQAGTSVTFEDDLTKGTTSDPLGNIVRTPPRAARVTLLRPRYQFVVELLKSVESL